MQANSYDYFWKRSSLLLALGGLLCVSSGLSAQTKFWGDNYLIPDDSYFEGEVTYEFAEFGVFTEKYAAWEYPFNDPVPDGVNYPYTGNDYSDNLDAVLAQVGTPSAFISSSDGIYSFSSVMSFVVHDAPAYSPGQVIFQTLTVGNLPDLESAQIYYRETIGGPLLGPIPYANMGFLTGANFDDGGSFTQAIAAWEWDLREYTIAEYYITFDSRDNSMSLWWASLDSQDGYNEQLYNPLILLTSGNYETVGSVEHSYTSDGGHALSYETGDEVTLTAEAAEGWAFVCWAGDIYSESAYTEITVGESMNVEAVFAPLNYDAWAKNTFTPDWMRAADPDMPPFDEQSAPSADANNNGLSNVLEYAFGAGVAELFSEADDILPKPGVSEDGNHLTMTYRKQPKATDLEYRVEVSDDLENWNYNGDGTGQTYTSPDISTTYNPDGTQNVVVTDLTDLSTLPAGTNRQMRLRIVLN